MYIHIYWILIIRGTPHPRWEYTYIYLAHKDLLPLEENPFFLACFLFNCSFWFCFCFFCFCFWFWFCFCFFSSFSFFFNVYLFSSSFLFLRCLHLASFFLCRRFKLSSAQLSSKWIKWCPPRNFVNALCMYKKQQILGATQYIIQHTLGLSTAFTTFLSELLWP